MKKLLIIILLGCFQFNVNAQDISAWKQDRNTGENDSKTYKLDALAFKKGFTKNIYSKEINPYFEIEVPTINGDFEKFRVQETSNFAPELQAKYPDIRSYSGKSTKDETSSLHISVSPSGIQTMVLRADQSTEFIEQEAKDKNSYRLFSSKKREKGVLPFVCTTEDQTVSKSLYNKTAKSASSAGVFKTFRLALSCTGEYWQYHVAKGSSAAAAINATMTRVNAIFNKDLALKLELIANNNSILYDDPAADPYSPVVGTAPGAWSQELQRKLDDVIGNANYDIGHLFGATGGGGNAGCIGCVCDAGKGSAYTSPANGVPEGNTFDLDFVAHELGHQLGANHTFSHELEGEGVNVEPGSGSTIMSYAGITEDYDVVSNSDDYFTYASIKQIQDNMATKTCGTAVILPNNTPTAAAGLDYTIPTGTAFVLKGTASDPNGNTMTYCWEQNDSAITASGANSFALSNKADGPLFRSLKPGNSTTRYMPALNNVLTNRLSSAWESVSTVGRTLKFAFTVRDNAAQGLAQTKTDEMVVTVDPLTGPFAVVSQSTNDISWAPFTSQTITWSVNNTTALPGANTVNIKLSTDGGLTFATTLVSNTPNDGSQTITVPNILAQNCRILIEPTNNIFYAVNASSFAIGYSSVTTCTSYSFTTPFAIPDNSSTTKSTVVPAQETIITDVNVSIGLTHAYLGEVELELINPQAKVVKLLGRNCGATNAALVLNFDDLGSALNCNLTGAQTVVPIGSFADYNGVNPQGTWRLKATDIAAQDMGSITQATIEICTKTFTTLSAPDFVIADFLVYPNPNQGNFNVQFSSSSSNDVLIEIHDLLGRKVYGEKFKSNTNFNEAIQLKNATAGTYVVSVVDGARKGVSKIVVQ